MTRDDCLLCVTGLGKSHRIVKGLVKIYHELKERVPAARIGLYHWDDYDKIIDDLKCWKPKRVHGAGHSYGASTLDFVFRALLEFPAVRVANAVFCDAVARDEVHKIDPDSLADEKPFELSPNVETLFSMEQDRGRITGHDFVLGPYTHHLRREVITDKRHPWLDRHPMFRELVFEAVLGS